MQTTHWFPKHPASALPGGRSQKEARWELWLGRTCRAVLWSGWKPWLDPVPSTAQMRVGLVPSTAQMGLGGGVLRGGWAPPDLGQPGSSAGGGQLQLISPN